MKFSEVVRTYNDYQVSRGRNPNLTNSQLKELAHMVKTGEINEAVLYKAKRALAHKAEASRRPNRRPSTLSSKARVSSRSYTERRIPTNKSINGSKVATLYEDSLAKRREANERRTGSRYVSVQEKRALLAKAKHCVETSKRSATSRSYIPLGTSHSQKSRPNNKFTFTEKSMNRAFYGIRSKIREARVALREDDINAATNAVQDATSQINNLPAIGADVPENIKSGVQNLKTQIDDLAVQCGIQPATDLGGDPNSQIPPVTGTDPNAGMDKGMDNSGMQQTFEARKDVRARIHERSKLLKKFDEGLGDTPDKMTHGEMSVGLVTTYGSKVSKANNETQLKPAPLGTMSSGSEKKSIKWPNKPIANPKEPKNIAENQSLTDKAITEFLNKKQFNFKDLFKDSNGILG